MEDYKMDETLNKYLLKFDEWPPIIRMIYFNHPIYQYFMKKALREGKPIDAKELMDEIERQNVQSDLID